MPREGVEGIIGINGDQDVVRIATVAKSMHPSVMNNGFHPGSDAICKLFRNKKISIICKRRAKKNFGESLRRVVPISVGGICQGVVE